MGVYGRRAFHPAARRGLNSIVGPPNQPGKSVTITEPEDRLPARYVRDITIYVFILQTPVNKVVCPEVILCADSCIMVETIIRICLQNYNCTFAG